MTLFRRVHVAVLALVALVAAGCGGAGQPQLSAQTQQNELQHAIARLGSFPAVHLTGTVRASAADLRGLGLSADQADALAGATYEVVVQSAGHELLTQYSAQYADFPDVYVKVASPKLGDVYEARGVEGTLYVRADAAKVDKLFPRSGYTDRLARLGGQGPAVLRSGGWLAIDQEPLVKRLQQSANRTPAPKNPNTEHFSAFLTGLSQWVMQHASKITRPLVADENHDLIRVTVNVRDLAKQLLGLTDRLPGGALLAATMPMPDIPDKAAPIDVLVVSQRVSEIDIWPDRFTGKKSRELPFKDAEFVVGVDTSRVRIDKPATKVTVVPYDQLGL